MQRSHSGDSCEGTPLHDAVKADDMMTFTKLIQSADGQLMQNAGDEVCAARVASEPYILRWCMPAAVRKTNKTHQQMYACAQLT